MANVKTYEHPDGTQGVEWRYFLYHSDAENYFKEWGRLKKPWKSRSSLSVCHNCKLVYYHSLIDCPTCPGKFDRVQGTHEELAEKLKGYKLGSY